MAVPPSIVRQLGNPSGLLGRLILRLLNNTNRGMNNLAFASLNLSEQEKVLEIGFGGGSLIGRLLADEHVVFVAGAETSDLALQLVSTRHKKAIADGRLQLRKGGDRALPYEDASFSQVVCVNVVYFWSDVPAMISEIGRVLCDPGQVSLVYEEWSPDKERQFEPRAIEAHLRNAGFGGIATETGSDRWNDSYYCTTATK